MLVTDARRARLPLLDLVAEAVAGGVDAIYLRDVDASSRTICHTRAGVCAERSRR